MRRGLNRFGDFVEYDTWDEVFGELYKGRDLEDADREVQQYIRERVHCMREEQ